MARLFYGVSTADVVVTVVADADAVGGFVFAPDTSAVFDVYDAKVAGSAVTDLLDPDDNPITAASADADGYPTFQAPDGVTGGLWLQDQANPTGARRLVLPEDLADRPGGGVTDHGALTGLADDDHTQYHNDTRGDVRYYTKAGVDALLPVAATTSVAGKVELATAAEVTTGTDTTRAVTPDILRDEIDLHTHTVADITDLDTDLFAVAATTLSFLKWDSVTSTYPNRSNATSDPNQIVIYWGGPGPVKSGTGSTGAVEDDGYVG